jgi:acid phosphatase
MKRHRLVFGVLLAVAAAVLVGTQIAAAHTDGTAVRAGKPPKPDKGKPKPDKPGKGDERLKKINHIVVIYEENHSFDNLYGGWEGVNGPANADAAHTTQTSQANVAFQCLYQDDLNLQAQSAANPTAPLTATCNDTTPATPFPSHLTNAPFTMDDYLTPADTTCPPTPLVAFSSSNGWRKGTGSPGGCTRDIVHRFYQEIFQLHGGQQNRYQLGSDAAGLTMGVYDTKALPVYQYLHSKGHPKYAIEDNFFQGAFGGSFLEHQWLIAAASPICNAANSCPANATHSVLDVNGFPQLSYPPASHRPPGMGPLYVSPSASGLVDGPLTQSCGLATTIAGLACGDYGVNTMQPAYQPSGLFGAKLPPQTQTTIGDELSSARVDWAWYAGGWANASGDVTSPGYTNGPGPSCSDPYADPGVSSYPRCPNNLFQYHHQPFNYFAAFTTETQAGRDNRAAHLRDEVEFQNLAAGSSKKCSLKPVSFVKPFGTENEHPGYASEPKGSDHLVNLLKSIENSKCAKDTMVVVTYDEFGGQWDHVPPPGQGNNNGPHDEWGPGTRIPTLVIAPHLKHKFVVDSSEHDTTSILATIEHRYGLGSLGTRDAAVSDLSTVFSAKKPKHVKK